jgi:hypothetical protein
MPFLTRDEHAARAATLLATVSAQLAADLEGDDYASESFDRLAASLRNWAAELRKEAVAPGRPVLSLVGPGEDGD